MLAYYLCVVSSASMCEFVVNMNASLMGPMCVGVCFVSVQLCVDMRRIGCLWGQGSCPGAGTVCVAPVCVLLSTHACVYTCMQDSARLCVR